MNSVLLTYCWRIIISFFLNLTLGMYHSFCYFKCAGRILLTSNGNKYSKPVATDQIYSMYLNNTNLESQAHTDALLNWPWGWGRRCRAARLRLEADSAVVEAAWSADGWTDWFTGVHTWPPQSQTSYNISCPPQPLPSPPPRQYLDNE